MKLIAFSQNTLGTLSSAWAIAFGLAVAATAQESVVEEKVPYVALVEELERELDEALLANRELERKVKNLSSALGVLAERESETKKTLEDLRESQQKALVNLELFSVALEREGGEGMQDLLMTAASDLRLVEEEKDRLAEGMVKVLGLVGDYLETAGEASPDVVAPLQRAITTGEEALGLMVQEEALADKSLAEARVITVNKGYNLVLIDVGQRQGLRVGTPISFKRKDRTVGSALVIDVRDKFSGAILLELADPNDQIMVGDSLQVDPEGV